MTELFENIPAAFLDYASKAPDQTAYRQVTADGVGISARSYSEMSLRVGRLARFLNEHGIILGSRVAIISNTRPEWMEADLAILMCGGAVVSVYQSLTPSDIGYILFDSGAEVAFVENEEQLQKLLTLEKNDTFIPKTDARVETRVRITLKTIVTFEETTGYRNVIALKDILSSSSEPLRAPVGTLSENTLASLVYTSGTTGAPKGVIQTHGNHLANVRQARSAEIYTEESTIFLFLPLAHSFAKLMGYIAFTRGVKLIFPSISSPRSSKPDPVRTMRDLALGSAKVLPIVPRILEKIKEGIQKRASKPGLAGTLLSLTLSNAERCYKNPSPSFADSLVFYLLTPLRKKIKKSIFGEHFLYAISGGAKLPVTIARFFDALQIEVLEGYGLTETCVATNVNRVGRKKIGSVGPVLASDIEVRITDEGEILFRGPNIAKGYLERPEATALAWDQEGWFHTGDLGSLDSENFLFITGRKKEIIVTSGGKKIGPDPIENLVKTIPLVSQAVLFGEGKQYCVVIVTLNYDAVRAWGASKGIDLTSDLHTHSEVQKELGIQLELINKTLASFETVKRFYIAQEEFTIDNGLLTPSFKVKRREVVKKYEKEIEELYPNR